MRLGGGEWLYLGLILIHFLLGQTPLQSLGSEGKIHGAGFAGKKYIYIKIVLCGKKLNCFRYANFQKETGVTANYSMFLLNLSASKNLRCLTHFIYLSGKKFENNIIVSMINEKAKYC